MPAFHRSPPCSIWIYADPTELRELEGFRGAAQGSPSGGIRDGRCRFSYSRRRCPPDISLSAPRREVVMSNYFRFVWTGILFLTVSAPRESGSDQFTAPGAIVANPDGSFPFDAKFVKEAAPDLLGGYGWSGITNIVGGYSADCFCETFCTMQPGATLTIHVDGQLTDTAQPGSAGSSVSFCTPGNNYGALTTVYPYGTTG